MNKFFCAATVLFVLCSSAFAQCPNGLCGVPGPLGYMPPPPVKQYRRIWNDEGLDRYGMDVKGAGQFRADLTARTLAALVEKVQLEHFDGYSQRVLARDAVMLTENTMIEMGLIRLVEVPTEKPKLAEVKK